MARKKVKKHKKPSKILNFYLPFFIIILGLILILSSIAIKAHNATKLSFFKSIPTAQISLGETQPTRILIPSLKIDLSLSETVIENGVWEIYVNGASHLTTSAKPGDKGNIIIYAHNTNDRFGKITQLKNGDIISLVSLDGKKHTYKVIKTVTVNPDQIELLLPTKSETLTLYTCTGFFDSKRFVVVAKTI